jgi:hypothetical protein
MIHPVMSIRSVKKSDVRSCTLPPLWQILQFSVLRQHYCPSPAMMLPLSSDHHPDATSMPQKYYPLQIPPQCSSSKKNEPDTTNITMIIIIISSVVGHDVVAKVEIAFPSQNLRQPQPQP